MVASTSSPSSIWAITGAFDIYSLLSFHGQCNNLTWNQLQSSKDTGWAWVEFQAACGTVGHAKIMNRRQGRIFFADNLCWRWIALVEFMMLLMHCFSPLHSVSLPCRSMSVMQGGSEFQHILCILNTNVEGKRNAVFGLPKICIPFDAKVFIFDQHQHCASFTILQFQKSENTGLSACADTIYVSNMFSFCLFRDLFIAQMNNRWLTFPKWLWSVVLVVDGQ